MNFSLNPKPDPINIMWVDSIRFITCGVNLFIEVRVVTASGVLPGANVDLSLECSSGELRNFNGTSNTAGLVKFKLGKAPDGSYRAAVINLTCSEFIWDASKGVTFASYPLSR